MKNLEALGIAAVAAASCGLEEQLLQLEAAGSPDTDAVLGLAEMAQQLKREIEEMEIVCVH